MTGDLPAQLRARADSLAFIRTDPDLVALLRSAADQIEADAETVRLQAVAMCRALGVPQTTWRRFCYSDAVAADPTEPRDMDRLLRVMREATTDDR